MRACPNNITELLPHGAEESRGKDRGGKERKGKDGSREETRAEKKIMEEKIFSGIALRR